MKRSGWAVPEPAKDTQYFGATSMVNLVNHTRGPLEHHNTDQPDGVTVSSGAAPLRKSRNLMALSAERETDRFYNEQGLPFVQAYFGNLHAWEPVLDEEDFHNSCEDIWEGDGSHVSRSFLALYYAVMGVGSLFSENNPALQKDNNRTKWSRVMHREALGVLATLGTTTNILLVQCWHVMVGDLTLLHGGRADLEQARLCQYDMNPRGVAMPVNLMLATADSRSRCIPLLWSGHENGVGNRTEQDGHSVP